MSQAVTFYLPHDLQANDFLPIEVRLSRVLELWELDGLAGFMRPDWPEKPEKLNYWLRQLDFGTPIPMPAFRLFDQPLPAHLMIEDGRHRIAALAQIRVEHISIAVDPRIPAMWREILEYPAS
jgi:hypothetical protein